MLNADLIYGIIAFTVLLVELLGIIAAVHAVMNARTSQGAIAWAISLVTFPWLALILYAILGRNKFKGYVSLRSSKEQDIHHYHDGILKEAVARNLIRDDLSASEKSISRLAEMPIARYNKSRLLVDGNETFHSIFEGIESAERYILIQFFIVKDDDIGRQLQTKLIEKAKENVKVYFLYDEIGSHKLPQSYLRDMQIAGVSTSAFHTTKGKTNRFQLNFRNHRKIVVIDGKIAYVGGHNVGDEYLGKNPKFGAWRDTHVKVEGPVVQAIQFCFAEDWYWATSGIPELNWELHKADDGHEEALMVASGPADNLETCGLMFVQAINDARQRIWIASPYFVPDLQILSALKLAVLRGVDVRILLPEKADHRTVYLASFSYYQNALPNGIKLYRYTAGFMHQKVFLIDSSCAAVGTANLDNRSFRLNFEITLLNYDPGFIKEVEDMLADDFSRSRPVTMEDYSQKSFFFKLAVRSARLLAPIL
ncbi:Cardiolipin synthase, bacterial type ClsA [Olavius sp. associated proteobacterium Delta 1]|nr:Cardiolipin synthase, bacterial type ClsA [Olavius sp. associated proteobacterium Delta 1]